MQHEQERRADEIAERYEAAQQAVADSQVRTSDVSVVDPGLVLLLRSQQIKVIAYATDSGTCQATAEEGDEESALKYVLGGVNALAGEEKGAAEVAGAVREQILTVTRRLTSAAKAAGRTEQVRNEHSQRDQYPQSA